MRTTARSGHRPLPSARFLCAGLLILGAAGLSGCTAMRVAKVIRSADTEVSVTVQGDEARLGTLVAEIEDGFGVRATLAAVHTGAAVLQITGTYKAVVDSCRFLIKQGFEVLANDKTAEAILQVAVLFLK